MKKKSNKIINSVKSKHVDKIIRQHLLITDNMMKHKPNNIKIIMEWGKLRIVIGDDVNDNAVGLHCFTDGPKQSYLDWFDKCSEFIVGSGSPQMEEFKIYRDTNKNDSSVAIKTRLKAG